MAESGSLLRFLFLLGAIGQVLGELNLGAVLNLLGELSLGGDLHLGGLSFLGGVLILHLGETSLLGGPLSGELFLLSLTTWITLGGEGLLDSHEGAGHLRLSTTFLFGEDCLPSARLLELDLRGDLILWLGQGSSLALSWLGPQVESGVMDFSLLCFFAFFFLAPFLLSGGEHWDAAVAYLGACTTGVGLLYRTVLSCSEDDTWVVSSDEDRFWLDGPTSGGMEH